MAEASLTCSIPTGDDRLNPASVASEAPANARPSYVSIAAIRGLMAAAGDLRWAPHRPAPDQSDSARYTRNRSDPWRSKPDPGNRRASDRVTQFGEAAR